MANDVRRFGRYSVLDSRLCAHHNEHIKYMCKGMLQRRRTRMMETLNVIERSYKKVLSYDKKKNAKKLGQSDD